MADEVEILRGVYKGILYQEPAVHMGQAWAARSLWRFSLMDGVFLQRTKHASSQIAGESQNSAFEIKVRLCQATCTHHSETSFHVMFFQLYHLTPVAALLAECDAEWEHAHEE